MDFLGWDLKSIHWIDFSALPNSPNSKMLCGMEGMGFSIEKGGPKAAFIILKVREAAAAGK